MLNEFLTKKTINPIICKQDINYLSFGFIFTLPANRICHVFMPHPMHSIHYAIINAIYRRLSAFAKLELFTCVNLFHSFPDP